MQAVIFTRNTKVPTSFIVINNVTLPYFRKVKYHRLYLDIDIESLCYNQPCTNPKFQYAKRLLNSIFHKPHTSIKNRILLRKSLLSSIVHLPYSFGLHYTQLINSNYTKQDAAYYQTSPSLPQKLCCS